MQNSVNVFAAENYGQRPGPAPSAAPSGSSGPGPSEGLHKASGLPDVVSGGNPLVAAANTLLNLIPQIRRMATNPDPAAFQHYLLECIRQFESRAGSSGVPMETIIGARYCICTAIDEAAAQTPWGGSGVWPQYSLLVALHNETWGGEKFFQLLSKLVQTPQQHIDLIELMYFCLMLGFEGRYHVIDNGRSQLESLKARLLQVIESTRGDRSGALSIHWKGVQRAAVPPWSLVPFWVAAVLALLIAFLIFLWFNYRLASRSDELFAAINGIRLPKMPTVVAVAAPKPRLRQFLEPEIREGLVEVNDQADRSIVTLRGDGLFDPASTEVKPRYVAVIQRIATALNEVSGKVVVNGYSDNTPIRTARFPSNWHLSQERALAVSAMLQRTITEGQRLRSEGRAESDPIAPNTTPEGRALNRRVEIVLLVPPQSRDAELQLTPGPAPASSPARNSTPKN
ncbi:DotU family type VI secretion system protein [Acidovorax sp. NCPPB 4044]|uniref:DotU family type VI secretion system protein n=1 Tax=Acidovorax sp. NCPPB 4044 TaxID=2940490 RepID=UPI002302B695|nr:DotU family type VI secretion system protein [Acidovorax sp. NCPPB 4044]MDA8520001.1 DotU family type VI secretion system protein [Acidovorax sp. NCPPB 4044]